MAWVPFVIIVITKGDNFTNLPQTLVTFADTPLTFKNSHLPPLNFQKFSLTPHPYKLGHNFFKKRPKYPCFLFFKKISRSWNFIQKSLFKIHYLKCQLSKYFFIIFLKNEKQGYFGLKLYEWG
jgi:hypothetical protein